MDFEFDQLLELFEVCLDDVPSGREIKAISLSTEILAQLEDPVLDWLSDQGRVCGHGETWTEIACPWSHLHSDGGTTAFYSGLGQGDLPRAFNCFHTHDHGLKDFLDWVVSEGGPGVDGSAVTEAQHAALAKKVDGTGLEVDEVTPGIPRSVLPDVVYTGNGYKAKIQEATEQNVRAGLTHLGVELSFNMLTKKVEIEGEGYFQSLRRVEDAFALCGIKGTRTLRERFDTIAKLDPWHPMEEWILDPEWDGKDRFGALLASIVLEDGEDPAVLEKYLRRWLIQGVEAVCGWRRAVPAQKSGVLVFAGRQGIGKTRWFKALAPKFFADGIALHLGAYMSKDSIMIATAAPLVELGELETTFTRSDAGALKNYLSRAEDILRRPYAPATEKTPRMTSYCATVNNAAVLVDNTGSRRFWPVEVSRLNPEHGIRVQQLWAQVYTWWKAGEQWWLDDEEMELHAERAVNFQQTSDATDALWSMFEGFREVPDERWAARNLSQILRKLELHTDPRTRTEVSDWLNYQNHTRKPRLAGAQKAWLVPVAATEVAVVDGQQLTEKQELNKLEFLRDLRMGEKDLVGRMWREPLPDRVADA